MYIQFKTVLISLSLSLSLFSQLVCDNLVNAAIKKNNDIGTSIERHGMDKAKPQTNDWNFWYFNETNSMHKENLFN